MKGIVYVGHGSRLQEGNEQFIQFIQSVMKERNERIQKIAFLELTTPTISDAVTETIIEGVTEIMIVPVLLFAAAHYKRDIPFEIEQLQKKYPQTTNRSSCRTKTWYASILFLFNERNSLFRC